MNKRFEIRRSIRLPIEVATSTWDRPLDLFACDLSPRGVFLESENMPEIGDDLMCSFNLWNGNRHLCLFGEVNRINWHRRKTDRRRPGFGVQFGDVRPLDRLRIRSALRGLPPPLPSKYRDGVFQKYLVPASDLPPSEAARVLETPVGSGSRLKIYY